MLGRNGRAALAVWVLVGLVGCGRSPETDLPEITSKDAKVGRIGTWENVPAPTPPWNLILLTLDTTRQDRLSCYGFSEKTTPNLDKLAAEGVLFTHALSPIPCTLPAHATILTGLYPYQHGVRYNGNYALADRFSTLAEILKARGYRTGAVMGGFPLDHKFGTAQGFEFYEDNLPSASRLGGAEEAQRPAEILTPPMVQRHGDLQKTLQKIAHLPF